MANKQLVEYVKEQLSHKMNINQLRTVLINEGWSQTDIESAITEVHDKSHHHNKKDHHTNFLAVAVLGIIVLILGGALFLVVFKDPTSIQPPPITPPTQINPPIQQLTGWSVCATEVDSVGKDSCYQKLNIEDELFDCDVIEESDERGFCYRAKETVLLQNYNQA